MSVPIGCSGRNQILSCLEGRKKLREKQCCFSWKDGRIENGKTYSIIDFAVCPEMSLFEVHVSKAVFGRVIRVGMGVGLYCGLN